MPKTIYLNHNAATSHGPEVIAAMRPFFEEEFGNFMKFFTLVPIFPG
jgi:cysteine sulfinate desulfinase/cysteine desulfurase-like protein